jgi:hypothetical protein
VPTRKRSSRAPRAARGTATTGEPSRSTTMVAGPQQEAADVAAATATATTTMPVSPAPALAEGDRAAVVEIPDDDAPPPGWGQWENCPAPALEPAAGVLVVQADGCMMPWRLSHGAEASSSCAAPPAPDAIVTRLEQERGHAGAPPAHFNEAQAEQTLWQEFRDHGAPLNNVLNEALRTTGVPRGGFSRRVFLVEFGVFPLVPSAFVCFLTLFPSAPCLSVKGAGGPGSGEVRPPCPLKLRS